VGEVDSVIGEHPHQGFEILSFVLKGSITHYDNLQQKWIPLNEGDVQIIRAGKGVSHAEAIKQGASIFQIWFDPDLNKSMRLPASYNDYASASFPVRQKDGFTIKVLRGEGSPLKMESEGVEIVEISFDAGQHTMTLDSDKIHSIYLVEGNVQIEGQGTIDTDDFLIVKQQEQLVFKANQPGKWFRISTPVKPSYLTYAQYQGIQN
jgi:redox-sensitive bicupin YhaK (pirin superfamily)